MTNKLNPKLQELVVKLREIFQIDRPDLDFGIYRILNARAVEINDYLQNRLAEKVQAALSAGDAANVQLLQAELQEAEKNAQALGVSPDAVPKVQELRAKLKDTAVGNSEYENAVFSHMLAFFSRYYDNGDFISLRRYKGDTYAIPYAGEEVMLHWANKDQYYTKSGENFSNYSFKIDDGRTVHFRLATADTAKDNRKDNDKERRFALISAKTVTRVDENGDEYEEDLVPVEELLGTDGNNDLVIRFEYVAQPKGTKQEALVTKAVEEVLADAAVKTRWLALGNRAPTEKNPQRTLLEKHLTDYTTKNTADYFIHKDLGGFLRNELDFYIKNEVMHLDDVQNAGAFADIEKNLRMIQCLRSISLELITFLAQLEDFQKKLWLKKKFVVSSCYCITLDRVPEELWPDVVANEQQWERWKQLGVWDGDVPGTMADLKAEPYRMVDTSLFNKEFQQRIQASIENIDENLGGVLINSDNFQALRFIKDKYVRSINCIYIDPPYNAQSSEIYYKNGFKHSSWLSLLENRLKQSKPILCEEFVCVVAIDEIENFRLGLMLEETFPGCEDQCVTVVHNPTGQQGSNISFTHEFAHFVFPAGKPLIGMEDRSDQSRIAEPDIRPLRNVSSGKNHYRDSAANCFYPILIKDGEILGFGDVSPNEFHPAGKNVIREDGVVEIYPIDPQGAESKWVFARNTVESIVDELHAELNERTSEWDIIRTKSKFRYKSAWVDKRYSANSWGSVVLNSMFGKEVFSYPKSVFTVMDAVDAALTNRTSGTVLDYFAGSGTTGHAVIALNRADKGNRKYILVEQGEYCDSVTISRIQKAVFSPEWVSGSPVKHEEGISHSFKVLKLESYEDTLNNLQLRRTTEQGDLLNTLPKQTKDDYLLNYMLDVESRGSLLSVEDFRKPFDYNINVAVDSAGAFEPRNVDMVETFNYLIGLCVKHVDAQPQRGFVTVTGTLPTGESCLVLWRDCDVLDYEGVSKLCDKLAINPADNEFDVVYINGDHNIPTVLTQTAEEGGAIRVLKLRQIESEFLERMFSVEDI